MDEAVVLGTSARASRERTTGARAYVTSPAPLITAPLARSLSFPLRLRNIE
jgi:hypothetical protein